MPAPKIFTGKTAKSVIAIPPTDNNQWQLSGVSAKYVTPIFHAVSEGIDELCDALRDTEQNTVSTEQRGIVNLEGADYKFTLNMSVTLNDFVCNSNTKQYTYSNLRLNYDFSYVWIYQKVQNQRRDDLQWCLSRFPRWRNGRWEHFRNCDTNHKESDSGPID